MLLRIYPSVDAGSHMDKWSQQRQKEVVARFNNRGQSHGRARSGTINVPRNLRQPAHRIHVILKNLGFCGVDAGSGFQASGLGFRISGFGFTVGLMRSIGRAADTALTKLAPPATPGNSFWMGAPAWEGERTPVRTNPQPGSKLGGGKGGRRRGGGEEEEECGQEGWSQAMPD